MQSRLASNPRGNCSGTASLTDTLGNSATLIVACLPKSGCMEAQSVVRACQPAEIDIDSTADTSIRGRLIGKTAVRNPHRISDAFKDKGYSFVCERRADTEGVAEEIQAGAFRVDVGVIGLKMRLRRTSARQCQSGDQGAEDRLG